VLLNEMADYHTAKSRAALDMIRSIANDSIFDVVEYRNWLDNLGGINADRQIIASFINEGDFVNAQSVLNMLPALYELEGDDLTAYNEYKQLTLWQMELMQEGRSIFELDSTEIFMLESYTESNTISGAAAKGILEFAHGYHFCNCLPENDSAYMKSSPDISQINTNENGMFIEAVPNPAKNWVAFNYDLPVYVQDAVIEITDVKGNRVALLEVEAGLKQKVWDIRKIESGVYIYTLKSGSLTKSGKVVIK
jgi:hypothetical protein